MYFGFVYIIIFYKNCVGICMLMLFYCIFFDLLKVVCLYFVRYDVMINF